MDYLHYDKLIRVKVAGMIDFIFIVLTIILFTDCTDQNQKTIGLCERVVISHDSKGFILAKTHRSFHPWGMNYGHYGMLTEDYQALIRDTLATDFQKMKEMGFNLATP